MRCLLFRRGVALGESITLGNRVALIFNCVILSGCSSLSPSGTSPIALDYNYRSVRPSFRISRITLIRLKKDASTTFLLNSVPTTFASNPTVHNQRPSS